VNVPTHESNQLLADRKTQTRAPTPSLYIADLLERVEDSLRLLLRHADSRVLDCKAYGSAISLHTKHDTASVSELDRIAE
jgi:hypothetical protein